MEQRPEGSEGSKPAADPWTFWAGGTRKARSLRWEHEREGWCGRDGRGRRPIGGHAWGGRGQVSKAFKYDGEPPKGWSKEPRELISGLRDPWGGGGPECEQGGRESGSWLWGRRMVAEVQLVAAQVPTGGWSRCAFEGRTDRVIYGLEKGFEGKKAVQDDCRVSSLNNRVNGGMVSSAGKVCVSLLGGRRRRFSFWTC